MTGILDHPVMIFIHMDNAKGITVTGPPFIRIKQRPNKIPPHIGTCIDGFTHGGQIRRQIFDPIRIMQFAILTQDLAFMAATILGDINRQAVTSADQQQFLFELFRVNGPADGGMGRFGWRIPPNETQFAGLIRPCINRSVMINSKPIQRTADARHIPRL